MGQNLPITLAVKTSDVVPIADTLGASQIIQEVPSAADD